MADEEKVSRADIRYQPLCKPIGDVMCMPKSEGEKGIFLGILDHYANQTNTAKIETGDVGGSLL